MRRRKPIDDTIVAISTPVGEGGIGIVRLSGPGALGIADAVFVPKAGGRPSRFGTYSVHYGHVVERGAGGGKREVLKGLFPHPAGGTAASRTPLPAPRIIDEALLIIMRAPKSFTREDVVELHCHGGIAALKNVFDLTVRSGARVAAPGEFTKRAFLNGRIDLVQAEAVLDVIRAKTDGAFRAAVDQLSGGLSKRVDGIRDVLVGATAEIEAGIDFPDEDLRADPARAGKALEGAERSLRRLVGTFANGHVLREGVCAVICGRTNVGKSSLMNLLLNRDRVIVAEQPGTTRDTVEELIDLKGVPIRLVDTAGIVETDDIVEREGVRRSKRYLLSADIILLVLDGSGALTREDLAIMRLVERKRKIVLINKSDLPDRIGRKKIAKRFPKDDIICISVARRTNIGKLEKALLGAVWSGSVRQGETGLVTNARHKELLERARVAVVAARRCIARGEGAELAAVELNEAIHRLGLIVGRSVADDLLDRIFERFCIGK